MAEEVKLREIFYLFRVSRRVPWANETKTEKRKTIAQTHPTYQKLRGILLHRDAQ